MGNRKDESVIGTWVEDYFVVGRVKSHSRHLACIHRDDFDNDIETVKKECYVLKRYCTKCEKLKDIDEFAKTPHQCKLCIQKHGIKYRKEDKKYDIKQYPKNKGKIKARKKIRYYINIEKIKIRSSVYYQKNKETIIKGVMDYYYTHLDERKIYCGGNKEKIQKTHKRYNKDHKEERKEKRDKRFI